MRKLVNILLSFCLVASFAFIGCGDDDEACPACPSFTQKAVMLAQADLYYGEFECWVYIFGINGTIPDIDSVKIAGRLLELEEGFGEGPAGVYGGYEGPAGSLDSGDDVEILVYTPTGTCSGTVTVLDYEADEPNIIDWSISWPYDTVAIGEEIEMTWNHVANADWYLVSRSYSYDSMGVHAYYDVDFATTDTSFTIPNTETIYNGYYYLDIAAFTGPDPSTESGNITCEVVKGVFASSAWNYFQVYVGTGDAWPAEVVTEKDDRPQRPTLQEIYLNIAQ